MHSGEDARVRGDDGVQHPEFGADRDQAARVVDLGEYGVRVGHAVVVLVDQTHDATLAGAFAERAEQVDADENFTGRGGAKAGRAGCDVGSGELGGFEFGGNIGFGENGGRGDCGGGQ